MGHDLRQTGAMVPRGLATLRGRPVVDFLSQLCRVQSDLDKMYFATYTPEPKLSERLGNMLGADEQELRDQAVATCHGTGIPFWDALFGICMKREEIPQHFLDAAAAHTSKQLGDVFALSAREFTADGVRDIIDQLPDGHGLVVRSKVQLNSGEMAHIPMMDFRCPYSFGNLHAVRRILKLVRQDCGVIVQSGRSYHYYGVNFLPEDEWLRFMAHSLLFAPIVDPRYVAHRLLDGECRLKIAASKNSTMPTVVDVYADSE